MIKLDNEWMDLKRNTINIKAPPYAESTTFTTNIVLPCVVKNVGTRRAMQRLFGRRIRSMHMLRDLMQEYKSQTWGRTS